MSTRAVITFNDADGCRYSVYQHCDGSPDNVLSMLKSVKNCWEFPRWEASDFSAAYVATHKNKGGGIRLSRGPTAHGDLDFSYEVSAGDSGMEMKTYNARRKLLGKDWIQFEEKQ